MGRQPFRLVQADGTVKSAADVGAGGGGGSYANPPLKTDGFYWYGSQLKDIRTTSLPPYGSKLASIFTMNTNSQWDKTMFFPFVAPKTGNVSRVMAYLQAGATGLNLLVGLYSDSSGYPANLLYKFELDAQSGGNKYATSFSDANGNAATFAITANTQYHWGFVRDTAATQLQIYGLDARYTANSGLNLNMADGYAGAGDLVYAVSGSSNSLATSYTNGYQDFSIFNASVKNPNFGIRYT